MQMMNSNSNDSNEFICIFLFIHFFIYFLRSFRKKKYSSKSAMRQDKWLKRTILNSQLSKAALPSMRNGKANELEVFCLLPEGVFPDQWIRRWLIVHYRIALVAACNGKWINWARPAGGSRGSDLSLRFSVRLWFAGASAINQCRAGWRRARFARSSAV